MNPAAIKDQIDRILHSQSLANKSQLRKLLEILSENLDSQANLNTESVIQELWPGGNQNETRRGRSHGDQSTAERAGILL